MKPGDMESKQNLSWSEYAEKVLGVPLSSLEKQLLNTMCDFYKTDPETYKERYLIAMRSCSKNSRFNFIPLLFVMDSIFANKYKTESEDKDGECMTQSHCFEVKPMAIKALRLMNKIESEESE